MSTQQKNNPIPSPAIKSTDDSISVTNIWKEPGTSNHSDGGTSNPHSNGLDFTIKINLMGQLHLLPSTPTRAATCTFVGTDLGVDSYLELPSDMAPVGHIFLGCSSMLGCSSLRVEMDHALALDVEQFLPYVATFRYSKEDSLELNDIEASDRYNIDTTGLVYFQVHYTEENLQEYIDPDDDTLPIKLADSNVHGDLGTDKRATITTNWSVFRHHANIREGGICTFHFRRIARRRLALTTYRL